MKPKPLDFICIAAVLLMAFALALPMLFLRGGTVVVTSDAGEARYALSDERTLPVTSGGHTLTVIIENGAVRVADADCPDGLCRVSPDISRAGESIVCLPARVVIRVEGNSSGGGTDGVVG